VVGDHHVEVAVTVHVGDADVVGEMASGKRRTGSLVELAFAVAKQDGQGSSVGVGNEDVGMAVVVHVGNGNPARAFAGGDGGLTESARLDRSVAH